LRFVLCSVLAGILALASGGAHAQDVPPPKVLSAIAAQFSKRFPATTVSFSALGQQFAEQCQMTPATMTTARDTRRRDFPVLVDGQRGAGAEPRDILARVTRLTVDADGSSRSYHPDDPLGEGVCTISDGRDGRRIFHGVCAVDSLASGGFRLFLDATRLAKIAKTPKGPDLAEEWKKIWPLIRERKIRAFNLGAVAAEKALERYYGFHDRTQNLTAIFNREIIPADSEGYPCRHGAASPHAGYFISATTLSSPQANAKDSCTSTAFIDAEHVPFFVLPAGRLGQAGVGDVVVDYLNVEGQERLAYGIAADTGPFDQFGEGSIAFNQRLLGDTKAVMNVKGVYGVDIDLKRSARGKEQPAVMAILVLDATKHLLKEDYSVRNVEQIARQEFARWGGGVEPALRRLKACAAVARQ
jgi:hypothetical protein